MNNSISRFDYFVGQALTGIIANGEPKDYKHNAILAVNSAMHAIAQIADFQKTVEEEAKKEEAASTN